MRPGRGLAPGRFCALRGASEGPLNLIHRNKVPNPLPARPAGLSVRIHSTQFLSLRETLDFFSGPVGGLLLWRARHAESSNAG